MDRNESCSPMNRRGFLMVAGGTIVGLGALGCVTHLKATAPVIENGTILLPFATYPALAQVGGVALAGPVEIGDYAGNIYVRRESADTALVLGAECRHAGCDVKWKPAKNQFVCPCHWSRYSATGERLGGLARKGLYAWLARIEGERVVIRDDAAPIRT